MMAGVGADGDASGDGESSIQLRGGLAWLSVALGVGILALAWHFGVTENPLGLVLNLVGVAVNSAHATFISGLLVNIGTTVLLAVVLIIFERTIMRQVQNATSESEQRAESVAERKAEAVIAERVEPLEIRLTDLASRFRNHADTRAGERRKAASAILDDLDFEPFAARLSTITMTGAITKPADDAPEDAALFIVSAGDELSAPRVKISYTGNDGGGSSDIMFAVMHAAQGDIAVNWNKDVSLDDALSQLNDELVRRGAAHLRDSFSPEALFRNIRSFLEAATAGRNADVDAWLSTSPARELIVDGWIITERGIEVRGRGILVPRQYFGRYARGTNRVEGERVSLTAPEGVDPAIYSEALVRAKQFMLGNPFSGGANSLAPRLPR